MARISLKAETNHAIDSFLDSELEVFCWCVREAFHQGNGDAMEKALQLLEKTGAVLRAARASVKAMDALL